MYTSGTPAGSLPAEILSYASPSSASYDASPHRPVIADLEFPLIDDGDCDPCIHYVLGDCNGDGSINTFDIDPFVFALTDSAGYIAQYGEQAYYCQCDITGDGNVNTFDIDPFVALLTG